MRLNCLGDCRVVGVELPRLARSLFCREVLIISTWCHQASGCSDALPKLKADLQSAWQQSSCCFCSTPSCLDWYSFQYLVITGNFIHIMNSWHWDLYYFPAQFWCWDNNVNLKLCFFHLFLIELSQQMDTLKIFNFSLCPSCLKSVKYCGLTKCPITDEGSRFGFPQQPPVHCTHVAADADRAKQTLFISESWCLARLL